MYPIHSEAAERIHSLHRINRPEHIDPACPVCATTVRRRFAEGCFGCQLVETRGFGPSHDASPECESGKHSHCSCDTCF